MATLFSTTALLRPSATTTNPKQPPPPPSIKVPAITTKQQSILSTAAVSTALAATLLFSPTPLLASADPSFFTYYGTASSAANYGGYGGNQSKRDTAEYTYEVPEGWKERLISKVEKGTNGTDSEFYNPGRRAEKEYLTYLPGFRSLAPMDAVLGNLALSDVGLQDLLATAENVTSEERKGEDGQVYYDYDIEGGGGDRGLISVTCARNKLYAHFVKAPPQDWQRDEAALRRIHDSFRTTPVTSPSPASSSSSSS